MSEIKKSLPSRESNLLDLEAVYKNKKKLNRFLCKIRFSIKNQEEAEDILHDVFANVWENIKKRSQPVDDVEALLYRSIKNRIVDSYRKKTSTVFSEMLPEIKEQEDNIYTTDYFIPDETYLPDKMLWQDLVRNTIDRVLDQAPAKFKRVFVDSEYKNIGFKEMAETTGINQNTCLARKRYAILRLRRELPKILSDNGKVEYSY